ncbi:MAG TPA: hypothetical protein VMV61_14175 [Patescibacteria group bacterium]|nr:hypothetical protein [Patescibacteria group bacterium]
MQVTLSPTEQRVLLEVLEEHHRELLMEIARTKHRDFKSVLRNKERVIESIFQKLEAEPVEKEEARAA